MPLKVLRPSRKAPTVSAPATWNQVLQKLDQKKHKKSTKTVDLSGCLAILERVEASTMENKNEADEKTTKLN
ncbi:hypothetical protein EYC84_005049 [Monilinia fructicola]|uniref:Uncharacterized protein n=1 Tax=Monilinia fructicola TaxID=38448 RepID=A0A5M9JVC7_MONFR|nr:hypothetical protein EYC84_005049 [Monilinia fructicola]